MAAGDDVVIFIRGYAKAQIVKNFIMEVTQRNKVMPQAHVSLGLGQCI